MVLLHDNACPHTTVCTQAWLELFNWELFDHHRYSLDLAPSDYHLFTYLKNWPGTQCFNSNELKEVSKHGSAHRRADFFDTGIQNLFPHMASASILVVPMMMRSSRMYSFFAHNKIYFLIACFLKTHWRLLSK
jgi:hypothetical protein